MTTWFDLVKGALPHAYAGGEADIVGYLQGSDDPAVWRAMERTGSGQMIILGSNAPTAAEWQAAGVAQRNEIRTIRLPQMAGFTLVYGGYSLRPWAHIVTPDRDTAAHFQAYLDSWRRNTPRRRQP